MWCDPLDLDYDAVDWCTPDSWVDSRDPDWRAAAYAQAATRPCTPGPARQVYDPTWLCPRGYLPWLTHCTLLHPAYSLAHGESCQSTPPVAR